MGESVYVGTANTLSDKSDRIQIGEPVRVMRAVAPAGAVALKLPVYVPSARWIVSPGFALPSAVFSCAVVPVSMIEAAGAGPRRGAGRRWRWPRRAAR